jgi:hypothetical protein
MSKADTDKTETTTKPNPPRRKDEAYFVEKQKQRFGESNIVEGSLLFIDPNDVRKTVKGNKVPLSLYDEHKNKQVVMIKTVDKEGKFDGGTRWVATSDLHHTRHSEEVTNAIRLEKVRARRKNKSK